jgi:apolipoprotein D and lipocalin family protein
MIRLLTLPILLALTACAGAQYRDTDVPIVAQADFDVPRYLGIWYEIARYPVVFQEGCTAVTATYGPVDADTISVLNTCHEGAPEGPERTISGTADIVGPGQLKVKFASVPFIAAPYWVLWVDPAYRTAVVGVPSGRAGWILSRTPVIDDATRARAEEALLANGYDPALLVNTPQARE